MEQPLEALADLLRTRRDALIAVLFSPHEAFDQAPTLGAQPDPDLIDHWYGACWLAEAAWRAVTRGEAGSDYATGDLELLYPLAARLRCLALSEPMRHRPTSGDSPWGPGLGFGEHGLVGRLFGAQTWNVVVGRGREARRIWRDCLNDYQAHPFLAVARPEELEGELTALVFARRATPLGFSVLPLREPAELNAEDRTYPVEVAARHLLPRFRLVQVAMLAWYAPHRWRRRARAALAIAVAVTAAAAATLAVLLWVEAAAALGGVAYLLIVVGALAFGDRWILPWLLRLPAAAAIGLLVLVTLPQDWWQSPRTGWPAAVVLGLAAYGYLVIEARNHDVGALAALVRSLIVLVIGGTHALLIVSVGLTRVAPAVVAAGSGLPELWTGTPSYGQLGTVLLLATAWCLAVGVFSQILWDDRPITAPLAHLSWRSGR
ncbi:MAG: hypothetical protein ACRDPT_17615 [Streptomycetales bacterium]